MELLVILIGYLLWRENSNKISSLGKISYAELQTDIARVRAFWNTIVAEAVRTGVNPCIIAGIIHRESQGNHTLVTGKPPTYGLMQLQERTARAHGMKGSVANLFNPETNIKTGVNYYASQVKRYNDWVKAISAYNAGHATSKNKAYVRDVVELSNIYCQLSPSTLPITPMRF